MRFQTFAIRRYRRIGAAAVISVAAMFHPALAEQDVAMSEKMRPHAELRFACETGDGGACRALGLAYETRTDLWGAPVRGEGVRRNDGAAIRYYRKACALGDATGCERLGDMHRSGKGAAVNLAAAQSSYAKACVLRGGRDCRGPPARLRE